MVEVKKSNMKLYSHRGASARKPENTLAAFQEAIRLGAMYFELDVQRTIDGKYVVCHDEEISRRSNGKGFIRNMTLEALKAYDFGTKKEMQRIPTLEEILDIFQPHMVINVEIKDIGEMVHVQDIKNILEKYKYLGFVISSFEHSYVYALEEIDIKKSYKYALLFYEGFSKKDVEHLGCLSQIDYLHISDKDVTKELVDRISTLGHKVGVYTVNDLKRINQLGEMGVYSVFTNHSEFNEVN